MEHQLAMVCPEGVLYRHNFDRVSPTGWLTESQLGSGSPVAVEGDMTGLAVSGLAQRHAEALSRSGSKGGAPEADASRIGEPHAIQPDAFPAPASTSK